MKKNLTLLFYFLVSICIIAWHGCKKMDDPGVIIGPKPNPLEEKVMASVTGRVVDENNKPVKDATVQAAGLTISTDVNGIFRFSNILLSKNAGFVQVEKPDYFKTGRTIFTNAGVVNNIEIKLIPKKLRGSFQASAGGKINIENGSTVDFPSGGIINKLTNTVYTGQVSVFGAYLSPEDVNLPAIMPGNLTGINTGNELKVLQTFGMIAVELEGSNGEKLNLSAGKSASISLPVPAGLQLNAPATIPLWYFNDSLGVWKEEGSALKQGNAYVGNVAHFSFWNCDVPNNFVKLTLGLKNQNGQALAGYQVILTNTQNASSGYGITDSSGAVTGAVPPSVQLQLKVYNKCHELVLTQNVGPFAAATDLGTISVTTVAAASITLSGKVTNCSFAPVMNGVADFIIDGNSYRAIISNGNYTITIDRCSASAANLDIMATDLDGNQQSSHTILNVTSGNYTSDINACGNTPNKYLIFTIGGNAINFITPADSISIYTYTYPGDAGIRASISSYSNNASPNSPGYQSVSFGFKGSEAPGAHPFQAYDSLIILKGQSIQYIARNITVNVTEYGSFGGYISGNFAGDFMDRTNTLVTGTCNFRIKRDN